jgi:hypothetical protein
VRAVNAECRRCSPSSGAQLELHPEFDPDFLARFSTVSALVELCVAGYRSAPKVRDDVLRDVEAHLGGGERLSKLGESERRAAFIPALVDGGRAPVPMVPPDFVAWLLVRHRKLGDVPLSLRELAAFMAAKPALSRVDVEAILALFGQDSKGGVGKVNRPQRKGGGGAQTRPKPRPREGRAPRKDREEEGEK